MPTPKLRPGRAMSVFRPKLGVTVTTFKVNQVVIAHLINGSVQWKYKLTSSSTTLKMSRGRKQRRKQQKIRSIIFVRRKSSRLCATVAFFGLPPSTRTVFLHKSEHILRYINIWKSSQINKWSSWVVGNVNIPMLCKVFTTFSDFEEDAGVAEDNH
jgi:hypothetical protein